MGRFVKVTYGLSMPAPETHLLHVEMDIRDPPRDGPMRIAMPAWNPGSYLIRDFARHVQDLSVTSGEGAPLAWQRIDKQTWEIETRAAKRVVIRYAVYANDLSVQTSHLDATHAFVNGTNVFLYVQGHKDAPARLKVVPPRGWHVDTALESTGTHTFTASDYESLVDAPLEIGTHRRLDFKAVGKPHRIALYGHGNEDEKRLVKDIARIVEEEAAIFGGRLPYERYLFIVHLLDKPGGGLEHRGSNASAVERFTFQPAKKYEDFLSLEAHEFFHTWNVKRIRPRVLGPFDFSQEVHTTLLWAMEGITSYYDHLVLVRAGLMTEARYRDFLAETITKLRQQPGRFKLSLADSSFLTWVKLYKQDANWMNTGVSYYLKGELIALVLDLHIRQRTKGKHTLDDVMARLYEKYPADGPGIPEPHAGGEDGWRLTLEEVTRLSWKPFWARYIEGLDEVDFEKALKTVGWHIRAAPLGGKKEDAQKRGDYTTPGAWLGIETKDVDKRLKARAVHVDSPAQRAGIAPEDELVALDGFQLKDKESLERRLRERSPGDVSKMHLFRRGELVALDVTLATPPPEKWVVEEVEKAPKPVVATRKAWLSSHAGPKTRPIGGSATKKGSRKHIIEAGE